MKTMSIRLQDETGQIYKWTIKHIPRVINCTIGRKTRVLTGWEFTDHDGYARFAEGNWQDLVSMFKNTAENYGFKLMSELS
jgi:hypothetical protein